MDFSLSLSLRALARRCSAVKEKAARLLVPTHRRAAKSAQKHHAYPSATLRSTACRCRHIGRKLPNHASAQRNKSSKGRFWHIAHSLTQDLGANKPTFIWSDGLVYEGCWGSPCRHGARLNHAALRNTYCSARFIYINLCYEVRNAVFWGWWLAVCYGNREGEAVPASPFFARCLSPSVNPEVVPVCRCMTARCVIEVIEDGGRHNE